MNEEIGTIKGKTMKEKVADYLTNLLQMGLSRGLANEKAYDYALALLIAQEKVGRHITAAMMEQAVELVKEAWANMPYIPSVYEIKR